MYKKTVISIVLVISLLMSVAFTVSAETENKNLISEIYSFSAKLYYYDTPSGNIVLKSVNPTEKTDDATEVAKKIEYTETRTIKDAVWSASGEKINPDWVNAFVDSSVWGVCVKMTDGSVNILYLKFN